MKPTLRVFPIIILFGLLTISAFADEGDSIMAENMQFFVRLIPPRQTFDSDMTPEEAKIMEEHYLYLKDLTARKKVLVAGPCFKPLFGMVILNDMSRDEANEIMKNDPSVKGGINKYDLNEMRLSLMAHCIPYDRYVTEVSDKILLKDVTIPAPVADVWNAWTTDEGVRSFFSPNTNVMLAPGGPFEIYFLMDNPYGLQGSEDCKILSFIPEKMLSFEWNAPPEFGPLRDIRTIVIILFEPVSANETRLIFHQTGWGRGDDWDKLFEYFDRAWGYVLENLRRRFAASRV